MSRNILFLLIGILVSQAIYATEESDFVIHLLDDDLDNMRDAVANLEISSIII